MGRLGSGVLGSKHAQFGLLELGGLFMPEGVTHAALEAHGYLRGRARIFGQTGEIAYISPRGRTQLFRHFRGTTTTATPEQIIENSSARS
jgi:hypothetical protein